MATQDTQVTFRAKDTIVAKENPKTLMKMSKDRWTLGVCLDGTIKITLLGNRKKENSSNVSKRTHDTPTTFIGEQYESMDNETTFLNVAASILRKD